MTSRGLRGLALLLAIAVLLSACGGEEQVGSDELLDFEEQSEGARLGERQSPTEKPKAKAAKAQPRKKRQTQAPTAVAPSPTPKQKSAPPPPPPPPEEKKKAGPEVALDIKITGDQSGTSQFDPSAARIFEGTCARWKNADTVPRSIEADNGAFSSGPVKPGKTWTWCPKSTGTFNYHDGTRPYAVAYIEVVKR